MRVHAVNITTFFVAFVVSGLVGFNLSRNKQVVIWLVGGLVGIFLWDVGSAIVIAKRELLMGWPILYPVGLIVLLLLQAIVKYINAKNS